MRQIYLTLLLAVMSLFACQTTSAYDFEVDGIYYTIYTRDMTAWVTYKDKNYSSYSGDITIPDSVTYRGKKLKVSTISEEAFYNCDGLTTVIIKNGIENIYNNAFDGCRNLSKIELPNSIESISAGAFRNCVQLKKILLPSNLKFISDSLFKNCTNLEQTYIPNSVSSIGDEAFAECKKLKNFILPKDLEDIGDKAFYNCKAITSFTIPASITKLGKLALYGSNISNIKLEDSDRVLELALGYIKTSWASKTYYSPLKTAEDLKEFYMGRRCEYVRQWEDPDTYPTIASAPHITLGEHISHVSNIGGKTIRVLKVKAGAEDIDLSALTNSVDTLILSRKIADDSGWSKLSRKIQESVKTIIIDDSLKDSKFYNASFPRLQKLVLGKNLRRFYWLVQGSEQLDTIINYSENPYPINNTYFSVKNYLDVLLLVPKGTLSKYMQTHGWKNFFTIQEMDEETTAIASTTIKQEKNIVGRYNASGQRLNTPQKGINIIKYSDGTTKKVIIK